MARSVRIIGLVVMVVSLAVLAVWQWLPALFFFPAGAAMLLWNGHEFSLHPNTSGSSNESPRS
ncbi:hypothetical protein JOD47_000730 [Arthrobacter tumbae]|nr:hypothetical protein [Arthrobacter tumbae]